MPIQLTSPFVAIACGGTGGHLFPGMAVGEELTKAGCDVSLLISSKAVDQEAVKGLLGMETFTLPAVGFDRRHPLQFMAGCWRTHGLVRKYFRSRHPMAVLGMGGFTSAMPLFEGRLVGARTFIHESNAIPGRANRWFAPWVTQAFVGFGIAAKRLRSKNILETGTPVREHLSSETRSSAREAMGLDPTRDVLLVMGGSQGASAVNRLFLESLPQLIQQFPSLQYIHLTGTSEFQACSAAHQTLGTRAHVKPFLNEMHLALGAATLAVSRAGASSIAEFSALGLPSILIPYPAAVDDHQTHNARCVESCGGAFVLEQGAATPAHLCSMVRQILGPDGKSGSMSDAIRKVNRRDSAKLIAKAILESCGSGAARRVLLSPCSRPLESMNTGLARVAGTASRPC